MPARILRLILGELEGTLNEGEMEELAAFRRRTSDDPMTRHYQFERDAFEASYRPLEDPCSFNDR